MAATGVGRQNQVKNAREAVAVAVAVARLALAQTVPFVVPPTVFVPEQSPR